MDDAELLALADRLMEAITSGDIETLRTKVYADRAVVWHNFDQVEQPVEENLRTLAWVSRNIAGLRYEDIRRRRTDDGFLQEHVLRGTAPNGTELEVPAVLLCTVAEGRITRIAEYLDTAHLSALLHT